MHTIAVVSGDEPFRQTLTIGRHTLVADEPADAGGGDAGPQPHELLLAALGACTSMTVRAYARRKQWPLDRVRVRLRGARHDEGFDIERSIVLEGALSDEQRAALKGIAEKCPVHRTLTHTIRIHTTLASDAIAEADEESFPASDPPAWTLGKGED